MPKFAANLSMMFTEFDFLDRFRAAANSGFGGVEFLFPYEWPAGEIAERLFTNGLKQVLFNMPPGDWPAGERGRGVRRDGEPRGGPGTGLGGVHSHYTSNRLFGRALAGHGALRALPWRYRRRVGACRDRA